MKKLTDKQRMDWLEQHWGRVEQTETGFLATYWDGQYLRYKTGDTLRQALDAAMRSEKKRVEP